MRRSSQAEQCRAAEQRLAHELQQAQEAARKQQAELQQRLARQQKSLTAAEQTALCQSDEAAKLRWVPRPLGRGVQVLHKHQLSSLCLPAVPSPMLDQGQGVTVPVCGCRAADRSRLDTLQEELGSLAGALQQAEARCAALSQALADKEGRCRLVAGLRIVLHAAAAHTLTRPPVPAAAVQQRPEPPAPSRSLCT